ncbi:MAG: hypothetical protein M3268_07655 [Acidobacteriota bacterium]|nr:hypothetical protein [Acidobacteriota bacterium]
MPFGRQTVVRLCAAFVFALSLCAVASAQQRPLITEDVDIIPQGTVRLQVGIDFFQSAKFPASGLNGDLTRVGVVGFDVGLAPNVEFQVEGVLQNFLSINRATANPPIPRSFTGNSTNDIGDFRLSTKIKLRSETKRGPSLGFKFGMDLPNSRQGRGIGVNATNAFGLVLVGKKFGRDARLNTFGNVGIGILTAPTLLFTQNDVLLYGVGGLYRLNDRMNLAAEINGRQSTRKGNAPFGTESQSQARLGMQIKASGLKFDFAGIKGLGAFSPRSGVTFGVTYDSPSIFTPAK